MDFAVTSCGKVITLQGSARRKTLKFVDERLISSTLFGYNKLNFWASNNIVYNNRKILNKKIYLEKM